MSVANESSSSETDLLQQARSLTRQNGQMPSRNQLMRAFKIGPKKAKELLEQLEMSHLMSDVANTQPSTSVNTQSHSPVYSPSTREYSPSMKSTQPSMKSLTVSTQSTIANTPSMKSASVSTPVNTQPSTQPSMKSTSASTRKSTGTESVASTQQIQPSTEYQRKSTQSPLVSMKSTSASTRDNEVMQSPRHARVTADVRPYSFKNTTSNDEVTTKTVNPQVDALTAVDSSMNSVAISTTSTQPSASLASTEYSRKSTPANTQVNTQTTSEYPVNTVASTQPSTRKSTPDDEVYSLASTLTDTQPSTPGAPSMKSVKLASTQPSTEYTPVLAKNTSYSAAEYADNSLGTHQPSTQVNTQVNTQCSQPSTSASTSASTRKVMPVWPVLLLTVPAFVSVWSGWVGLGQLTGFGIVHPLPGIWDEAQLNTAITLPIGVEAYAAYALYAWLKPGVNAVARKFAKWSAIGSMFLGAGGQVAYHLLSANGAKTAPMLVTVIVSCFPVLVLGMGMALAHMVRHTE